MRSSPLLCSVSSHIATGGWWIGAWRCSRARRQPTEQLCLLLPTGSRPIHLIGHRQGSSVIASPVRAGFDSIRIDSVDSNRLDKQKFKFWAAIGRTTKWFSYRLAFGLGSFLCPVSPSYSAGQVQSLVAGPFTAVGHLCEPSLRCSASVELTLCNRVYPGPPTRMDTRPR